MFIIWGSKARTRIIDQGTFHCPYCKTDQEYQVIVVRKYFTLFFVPLFSYKDLGMYLVCLNCESMYTQDPNN